MQIWSSAHGSPNEIKLNPTKSHLLGGIPIIDLIRSSMNIIISNMLIAQKLNS